MPPKLKPGSQRGNKRRVIGAEHIEAARKSGRLKFELLERDLVTSLARETAARLGVALVKGPLEAPVAVKTDGNTAMRRALYRRGAKWVAPKQSSQNPNGHLRAKRFAKIALIGAGGVGTNIAHLAAVRGLADTIALVDIVPGLAAAMALDLNHASGITRTSARVTGSGDATDIAGAAVVIVTAGRARGPGMTRADLIGVNSRIITAAAETIKAVAPLAVVIVVTNPLDEMTALMLQETGFPRERVIGMAGTLDSSRFRNALALAARVTPGDVEAITLGSHGDGMTPIPGLAKIKGRPLSHFLTPDVIARCVQDAVTGGGQVVALKKSGSATIAPAHATIELLDHMRGAKTGPVPASVMLEGEFGISQVVLGVPAVLGTGGLIAVKELTLTAGEHSALHQAADAVKRRLETAKPGKKTGNLR